MTERERGSNVHKILFELICRSVISIVNLDNLFIIFTSSYSSRIMASFFASQQASTVGKVLFIGKEEALRVLKPRKWSLTKSVQNARQPQMAHAHAHEWRGRPPLSWSTRKWSPGTLKLSRTQWEKNIWVHTRCLAKSKRFWRKTKQCMAVWPWKEISFKQVLRSDYRNVTGKQTRFFHLYSTPTLTCPVPALIQGPPCTLCVTRRHTYRCMLFLLCSPRSSFSLRSLEKKKIVTRKLSPPVRYATHDLRMQPRNLAGRWLRSLCTASKWLASGRNGG